MDFSVKDTNCESECSCQSLMVKLKVKTVAAVWELGIKSAWKCKQTAPFETNSFFHSWKKYGTDRKRGSQKEFVYIEEEKRNQINW